MSRPRDNQRSRVYAAERAHSLSRRKNTAPMTLEECQAYADKVINSAYIVRRHANPRTGRVRQVSMEYGRNGGMAYSNGMITLGVWARQPMVVLHEVAHILTPYEEAHGWKFCAVFLDLVRAALGKAAEDELKACFREHKVRFKAPVKRAPLSPERRAALVEQLAAARAARTP